MRPLTYKAITLEALEQRRMAITGEILVISAASAQIYLRFDDGEDFPAIDGFTIRPGSFRSITFRNPGSTSISIEFYAGTGEVNYLGTDYVRNRSTTLQATVDESLTHRSISADGGTVDLPGSLNGKPRKQIIVTNLETAKTVYVCDADSEAGASILPQQAWTLETDGRIIILNPNGTSVNVQILEVFYS